MPDFLIDLEDGSGTKYGPGPIRSAVRWQSVQRLDRAGRFSFEVPASDERVQHASNKRVAVCKAMVGGVMTELGSGVIDDVRVRRAGQRPTLLRVRGDDLLRELTYRVVGDLEISADDGNITPDQALHHTAAGGNDYLNSLPDSAQIDNGEYLYIGHAGPFSALTLAMSAYNGNAATLTAQYYSREYAGWVNITVSDGTLSGGATLGQDGSITWTRPADWGRIAHDDNYLYWLRLNPSANLTNVTFTDIDVTTKGPAATGLADIMGYAPAGWSLDAVNGYTTTGSSVMMTFSGETVLEALTRLAEQTGEHFRLGSGRKVVWRRSAQADSGIRAVRAVDGMAIEGNDDVCLILDLRETRESYDQVTRIYPYGAGIGDARVTLAKATDGVPANYTLSTANNYVEYDYTLSSPNPGQRIERTMRWQDIAAPGVRDAQSEAAGNELLSVALEYLSRFRDMHKSYQVRVTKLEQALYPGDSVRVVYKEIRDGYTLVDLDADMTILEVTTDVDRHGVRAARLVVATVDAWPATGAGFLMNELQQARRLAAHVQPL